MRYSKKAKEAFMAERARHHQYWMEHLEHSFSIPFSWLDNVRNSVYRRNFVEQPKPIFNFSTFQIKDSEL